jgi:hypothetical protein
MTCRDVVERLGLQVLGALEPSEAHEVEAHLDLCAGCQRRYSEHQERVALLPQAVQSLYPQRAPAALKARVLDAVQAERGRAIAAERFEGPRSREFWLQPRWVRALAAANLVLLVAVGWLISDRASRVGRLESHTGQLEIGLQLALTCTKGDDHLPGDRDRPESYARSWGRLCTQPGSELAAVLVADTPPAPPHSDYHLWFRAGDRCVDAGVVHVGIEERGWLITKKPEKFEAVLVTLEPRGDVAHCPRGPTLISK